MQLELVTLESHLLGAGLVFTLVTNCINDNTNFA